MAQTWHKTGKHTLVQTTLVQVAMQCTVEDDHCAENEYRKPVFHQLKNRGFFGDENGHGRCSVCSAPAIYTWGPAQFRYPDEVQGV